MYATLHLLLPPGLLKVYNYGFCMYDDDPLPAGEAAVSLVLLVNGAVSVEDSET